MAMVKWIGTLFFLAAFTNLCRAEGQQSKFSIKCSAYANETRHQCLQKQLAISEAELEAAAFAVRKMMAQWDDGSNRKHAKINFEATIAEFQRYKRAQCEFFASMRYGVGDKDEIEIIRLECVLHMNSQRTELFDDLTKTIVM
jgi:CRISPR/Cas system Type II protein with McrA/HNH and RuvC-like nuclease domain